MATGLNLEQKDVHIQVQGDVWIHLVRKLLSQLRFPSPRNLFTAASCFCSRKVKAAAGADLPLPPHLFLVVQVHLPVGHLPPQPVHVLAQLQPVLPLVRGLVQLLGQVEVLTVQLGVLLSQRGQLLLQVRDHLRDRRGFSPAARGKGQHGKQGSSRFPLKVGLQLEEAEEGQTDSRFRDILMVKRS